MDLRDDRERKDRSAESLDDSEHTETHLVDEERQETGRDDGVADPDVVVGPALLEPVEVVEVHRAVKRILRLGSVHGLQMRGEGREVLVQDLHCRLRDHEWQR